MNRLILEVDERLDMRCAEIYLTTKGRISFHCTLCEEGFVNFESYETHLYEVHLSTNKIKIKTRANALEEETLELTQNSENEFQDFDNKLEEMVATVLMTDAETSSSSSLIDNEYYFLKKDKKHAKSPIPIEAYSSNEMPKENSAYKRNNDRRKELIIPKEIREIGKRCLYKTSSISITEEDRKHKCPICSLGFKNRVAMLHHFKRHSNVKNHPCSECDKKFYTSTELNFHKRYHTQERTFLCTECGRMFATKYMLDSHLKRHRGQRDYHCQYPSCQKSFFDGALLKNHMLTHSSVRRFSCTVCEAAFKRSTALKNHLKLHENKREYKCKICEAGFNQQAGLFSHIKTTHKSL